VPIVAVFQKNAKKAILQKNALIVLGMSVVAGKLSPINHKIFFNTTKKFN
jgi:hypothetical protein